MAVCLLTVDCADCEQLCGAIPTTTVVTHRRTTSQASSKCTAAVTSQFLRFTAKFLNLLYSHMSMVVGLYIMTLKMFNSYYKLLQIIYQAHVIFYYALKWGSIEPHY